MDKERLARAIFAKTHPWEDWDDFDQRYKDRGNVLHPMQLTAIGLAETVLEAISAQGFVIAPSWPTPERLAQVVQQTGRPDDACFSLAVKAIGVLGEEVTPLGLDVLAELARDYRAMINAIEASR